MTINDAIKEFFKRFVKSEEIYAKIGTVSNVDEVNRICDVEPIDGEAEILNVRLQSVTTSALGIVPIPKDGSKVVVNFLNNEAGFVSLYSEIDKLLIDTDLVKFNGGSLDGLVKINELTTKLNLLKTEVQAELVKIQTGLAGVGGVYTPGTLTSFDKNNYENTKIKQ